MASSSSMDYYSVEAIAAEETLVPVRLVHGCTGVGTVIDPSSDVDDLMPGARLDMPLWLASGMAQRHMAAVDLPIFYGNKMRRKMKAGAGCEDLRVRCPHYYTVAQQLHAAMSASQTADEGFPAFILNTFRNRYRDLLTKAPQIESSLEASQVQAKLCVEELSLFNEAAEAAAAFERWKSCRAPALARHLSLKRKWAAAANGAEEQQQQVGGAGANGQQQQAAAGGRS